VRLEEPVSHGGATILLDHRAIAHRGADSESSLETAVVLAASVCLHLLASDHQVKLVSHRGTVLAEGHDIADDVLAGLAVLEPDPAPLLTTPPIGRAGLLLAILGEMSASEAALLAVSRRRGVNAVALVLATQEWTAPSASKGSAPLVDILRAAQWRVIVVHPHDDLAAAWRRACSDGDGYSAAGESPRLMDRLA
jgi:uncharacterized protein (DUF58 family)